MKQREIEKLIRKYLIIFTVLVLVIIYFGQLVKTAGIIMGAFTNILLAAMLAYIINIVMVRIESLFTRSKIPIITKTKRPLSLLLSLTVIFFILYALIALVFPAISEAVNILINTLPKYVAELQQFLQRLFKDNPEFSKAIENLKIDWRKLIQNGLSILGSGLGNIVGQTINMITTIAGSLFTLILVIIFAIYILLDKERLIRIYERLMALYLPKSKKQILDHILTVIHHSFSSFIAGQCLEAVILGALCTSGMFLLRMPYPLMVGTLVGVINIIPIVGAYIGGAVGMFMVFTVDPMLSIGFLVYLIILQQIESNLIYPRVVGNSVGLPGIYVLGSVMVFGSLAGILGMFLGIPTVASLYKLAKEYVAKKEQEQLLKYNDE
ncbi:AI-2E family transporter [Enterococcus faecalis]